MKTYKKYRHSKKHLGLGTPRFLVIVSAALIICVVGGVATLRVWYANNLRPISSESKTVYFTVEQGETKHQIATGLEQSKLIRSSKAFETYLRSNEIDILQAGTYSLSPSMSVSDITDKMVKGDVTKNLLTILPGKRIDQVKEAFAAAGYNQSEIDQAFDSKNYTDHPALASLPAGASLEGFLYPDSFQKEVNTPASVIIRESLDEMQKYLTQDVVNGLTSQGLNVYQGVTLASIVYKETGNPAYQPSVAQVFYNRLQQNMGLESDTTYHYAAAVMHQADSPSIDSPYNTYQHKGLPPGPINNVAASALKAVAHPIPNDYLYFIAGDDEKIHFSHTVEEHQAAIKQYCQKSCG
jgi:UPF0755 protein